MKFTSTTALFVISIASAVTAAPFHNVPAYSKSTTQSSTCTEASVSSSTTVHSSQYLEYPSIITLDDKPKATTVISKVTSTSTSTTASIQRNPFELGTLHLGHGPVVISHSATSTSITASSVVQSIATYTPEVIMHIETSIPIIIKPTQVLSSVASIAYSHKDTSSTSSIPCTATTVYPSLHFGHGPAIVSPALVTLFATTSTVVSSESVSSIHLGHGPVVFRSSSAVVPTTMVTQIVQKSTTAAHRHDSIKSTTQPAMATSTGTSSRATKTIHQYVTVSVVRETTKETNY